jgi:hypothetical protein
MACKQKHQNDKKTISIVFSFFLQKKNDHTFSPCVCLAAMIAIFLSKEHQEILFHLT